MLEVEHAHVGNLHSWNGHGVLKGNGLSGSHALESRLEESRLGLVLVDSVFD